MCVLSKIVPSWKCAELDCPELDRPDGELCRLDPSPFHVTALAQKSHFHIFEFFR